MQCPFNVWVFEYWLAVNENFALILLEDSRDMADYRRFTRSVWPDKTINRTRRNIYRQLVQRLETIKLLLTFLTSIIRFPPCFISS